MKQELSYDQRYRRMARRFEGAGAAVILAGVLLDQFLLVVLGVLVFGYGFGCLQPVNQVKAFAQQCAGSPSHELAQGLLNSLQGAGKLRMTAASIQLLQSAADAYARMPDADPQRVRLLRDAMEARVVKRII